MFFLRRNHVLPTVTGERRCRTVLFQVDASNYVFKSRHLIPFNKPHLDLKMFCKRFFPFFFFFFYKTAIKVPQTVVPGNDIFIFIAAVLLVEVS